MIEKNVYSQLDFKINVEVRVRNVETGEVVQTVSASNRVTNLMLAGIANLLYGDTGILNRYVPAYVAVGDNLHASPGANVSSSNVEVSDSMLYGEIPLSETGINERIKLSGKTITNNGDYVMVGMNSYIHSNTYNYRDNVEIGGYNNEIKEVGLFTKESGNNCLARVILGTGVQKREGEVVDIVWGITSTSVANNSSN